MKSIIIAIFVLFYTVNLHANRKDWVGSNDDSWNLAVNWSPIGVPSSTDSIFTGYGDVIDIPVGYVANAKYVRLLASFNNYGELIIHGGKMDVFWHFYNHGKLTINNSVADAALDIDPIQNLPLVFHNYGEIIIDGATGDAINQSTYNKFTNYESGIITLKNYDGYGLDLIYLENLGKIRMEDSGLGGFKLDLITDTLWNNDCGKIINLNKWEVNDGYVLNDGAISQKSPYTDVFSTDLVNTGVIQDIDGTMKSTEITNTGLWIKPYLYELPQGKVVNIFITSGPAHLVCSGLYNDKDLTSFAGPYDNVANQWTPNINAVGDTQLYVSITNLNTTCIDTITFKPNIPVVGVNFWVGNAGAWTNANNWSSGTVPTAIEKTAIYNSTDMVWIPANQEVNLEDLYLKGDFLIKQNASLIINDKETGSAIYCDSCKLVNNGSINFNKTSSGLFIRRGSMINNNSIHCDSTFGAISLSGTSGDTSHYVKNYGSITGSLGPILSGNDTPVENHGNIILSDIFHTGIDVETLDNYGNISIKGIDDIQGVGIKDNVTNHANGNIIIQSLQYGFSNAELTNAGQIDIDSCYFGLSNNMISTNQALGSIDIQDCDIGMSVGQDFTNELNATIDVKHVGTGIKINGSIFDRDKLLNNGIISIDSIEIDGIDLNGSLTNQGKGLISINHCLGNGISGASENISIYNNDTASITIYNCGLHGMNLLGTYLTNEAEAAIIIDTVSLDGIHLNSYNTNFHSFGINYGNISIGKNVIGNAISGNSNSTFTNNTCSGKIYSNAGYSFEGMFNNYGLYSQLSQSSVVISPGFLNTGIVADPFHLFQGVDFNNQGIHVIDKSGSFEEGEIITNILVDGSNNSGVFTIAPNWHLKSQLDQLGGIYDPVANTLTPSSTAVDSSTFYFQISPTACTNPYIDTLSLKCENPISPSCGFISWNGGKGNWLTTSKWDKNRLPSPCDTVLINQTLDSIIVNSPNLIELSSLVNYGNLLVSAQSEINIIQSNTVGLLNYNNIQNSGIIHLMNSSNNGYVGMDNSMFTNSGTLQISQSAKHGLWMRNAIFDNKIGASVLIVGSSQDDLRLLQSSIFYQSGSYNGQ